jgi:hypothetical protein
MSEYLHVIDTRLQTPVQVWRHPDTGRRITLVATVHGGEPRYFDDLNAVVDLLEQDGAAVHVEGSPHRIDADLEAADLTDPERDALLALRRSRDLSVERMSVMGWVGQRQAMPIQPSWRVVDLNPLEIIRLRGAEVTRHEAELACHRLTWPEDSRIGPARYRLRTVLALRTAAADNPEIQRKALQAADPIVLGHRTTHALAAAQAVTEDVVLVWGARHCPAMSTDLAADGFIRTEVQWYTVGRLPSLARIAIDLIRGQIHGERVPTSQGR